MKRNPKPWTQQELALLGKRPDAEVAELIDRTFGTVWQKRRALGIDQPALRFRKWTRAENKLVGTAPDAEVARRLGRTESAIKSRRAILERQRARNETKPHISNPKPCPAVLQALGAHPVTVPRDPSLADDERYRLIDGPYYPPRTARGRFLVCQLRGTVRLGGYTDAPIPWPKIWCRRSLVICGDLLRALRTESVYAVSYHWGLSRAIVSYYRQQLSIPRLNPGSYRLFREFVIEASRTPEARARHSAAREGKPSTESVRDRERLRRIQRRPKPKELRRRMSERMRRRFDLVGPYPRWTPEELAIIGTMRDREVARRINRSLSAVRAKKFALRAGFK
ncbi:MAG TPA: hypothetical protein VNZ64_15340 [Candidatus Acidoferrum sp.]|jgi:hypothetical protein|nr:hypothetical protein [Candidatus Acidoferrum sp.]